MLGLAFHTTRPCPPRRSEPKCPDRIPVNAPQEVDTSAWEGVGMADLKLRSPRPLMSGADHSTRASSSLSWPLRNQKTQSMALAETAVFRHGPRRVRGA